MVSTSRYTQVICVNFETSHISGISSNYLESELNQTSVFGEHEYESSFYVNIMLTCILNILEHSYLKEIKQAHVVLLLSMFSYN